MGETIDFLRRENGCPTSSITSPCRSAPPSGGLCDAGAAAVVRAGSCCCATSPSDSLRTISVMQDEGDGSMPQQVSPIRPRWWMNMTVLVGVITIDDAMSVLDESYQEIILRPCWRRRRKARSPIP